MGKAMFRRISAVILTLSVMCVFLLPVTTVFAAPATRVVFDTVSASENALGGNTITLPVVVNIHGGTGDSIRFAGISYSVSYDKNKLAFVEGPVQSDYTELKSALIYHNASAAKISLSWTGNSPVELPAKAKLFTFSFKVLDGAASGTTPLTVTISELFDSSVVSGSVIWRDIDIANTNKTFKKDINISAADSKVTEVINAIGAIGTVAYTKASLDKITAAAAKYALLTPAQKAAVTNYDVLLAAQIKYEELKNAAANTAVNNQIAAYLAFHSRALSLTVDTVTLDDLAAVTNAWNSFNDNDVLSPAARFEIYHYSARLKALVARLEVLKKADDDRRKAEEAERLLREEAAQMAAAFKKDKASVLVLKDSDLIADHYQAVYDSVTLLNMFADMNPYVSELLEQERVVLSRMFTLVEALYLKSKEPPAPGELEADKFRSIFAWVLSQTEGDIAAEDLMDIMLAVELYKMQSEEAQALLSSEFALLNKLFAKAKSLQSSEDEDTSPGGGSGSSSQGNNGGSGGLVNTGTGGGTGGADTDNDTDTGADGDNTADIGGNGTNNTGNQGGGGNTAVAGDFNLANREMGIVVYILLLLLIPALFTFGSLQMYYRKYINTRTSPRWDEDKEEAKA